MAKKETKLSKKEIIDKVIQSIDIATIPLCSIVAVWSSIDVSAYIAGGLALICSALEYAKLFIKD